MAYPYNFDGREGIDPNDPRYGGSYYPGRIQPSGNYNLYPSELDIEVESPEHQNGQYADHPTHIYSNGQRYPSYEEYASPGSSNPSTDISGMWGTASRNISSRTAPEEDLSPVQAGHRCIFHWIGCEVKASNHDDWVQHIYYGHFDLEERDGKPDKLDFGRAPTSWTCRFRGCGTVVKNDDHRALWDGKLAHIFGHFKNDHGRPEDIQEDLTWLKYYEKMRLCRPVDVYGGVFHPPAQKPSRCTRRANTLCPQRANTTQWLYAVTNSVLPPTRAGLRPPPADESRGIPIATCSEPIPPPCLSRPILVVCHGIFTPIEKVKQLRGFEDVNIIF